MKIVFTSCARYKETHDQKEWLNILDEDPDQLFLLGDNIYMDWAALAYKPLRKGLTYFKERMDKLYDEQWNNPNFKQLITQMKQKNGFHGIWDDHDCGWNNIKVASLTDEENKKKFKYSRKKFLDKFPFSKVNNSIYYAHDAGDVRFVFLDNRSFATNKKAKKKVFLGEEQFQFLEDALSAEKAIIFICGGLTLSSGHEKFLNYEEDYKRFCNLVANSPSKVIYLSGDIHKNKFVTPNEGETINGLKPPFEIISSGVSKEFERKHRWCMLEIDNQGQVKVSFFNKGKKEDKKSDDCTTELMTYLL